MKLGVAQTSVGLGGSVFELGGECESSANDFDDPDSVRIAERDLPMEDETAEISFPAHSIVIIDAPLG